LYECAAKQKSPMQFQVKFLVIISLHPYQLSVQYQIFAYTMKATISSSHFLFYNGLDFSTDVHKSLDILFYTNDIPNNEYGKKKN